jgi:hypothetical protein
VGGYGFCVKGFQIIGHTPYHAPAFKFPEPIRMEDHVPVLLKTSPIEI